MDRVLKQDATMAGVLDDAVVLRRLDYSETSQVLLLFTRHHGAVRVIAKGAKRSTKTRFTPGIDLLERGQVVFIPSLRGESPLGTLTEWRQTDAHLGLRSTLGRWYAGQYVAEITALLLEAEDPHPELFDALMRFLAAMNGQEAVAPQVASYQSTLLKAAGLWPELTHCVSCERPAPSRRPVYYAPSQGGLICSQCRERAGATRRIDAATREMLACGQFSEPLARRAVVVMDEAICHAIGRPTMLAKWSSASNPQKKSHK